MPDFNQWSTIAPFIPKKNAQLWIDEQDRARVDAYLKYDEFYWNDSRAYALRVLEGEEPLYIPNARTIVDTTAHYILKGLELTCTDTKTKTALDAFLKRETFYSRFQMAKWAGVVRGDYVFHMTADPSKANGLRISLNSVDPGQVFPIWDEDMPDKMIGCNIAVQYQDPKDPLKSRIRRLQYKIEMVNGQKRISRQEGIYQLDPGGRETLKKIRDVIPFGLLDPRITALPIYWFKNRDWEGDDYGSSELRGLESMAATISQGSTDVTASLSLEGLGVYATDGGRPVNDQGEETDWEVAPGKVMEVPSGSYFRRVEGVGSITPAKDQIDYLEEKIHEATGLSDVALGQVDAQVAASGIALAIKFIPTLAKIETRDQQGLDKLTQLFYDWKTWYDVFEQETLGGDIVPVIGDKLPTDRTARINELNNMKDRNVISSSYYRQEMARLGYKFPTDSEMEAEIKKDLELAATVATQAAEAAAASAEKIAAEAQTSSDESGTGANGDTLEKNNSSNNAKRPNESSGTEAK